MLFRCLYLLQSTTCMFPVTLSAVSAEALIFFFLVSVKQPMMMRATPFYPTEPALEACVSSVAVAETSKTQFLLFINVSPLIYCHPLKFLKGPHCILCTFLHVSSQAKGLPWQTELFPSWIH